MMDDLQRWTERSYEESISNTISKIVDYCRSVQKGYVSGDEERSGVYLLTQLLTGQTIDTDQYVKMREAVENYNEPYEIKLIKTKEP